MSKKVDNVIASLQENVDGENVIAFGLVSDITANDSDIKCFVVGREGKLAEAVASVLEDAHVRKVFSEALALRVRNKMSKVTFNGKKNEKGHNKYN